MINRHRSEAECRARMEEARRRCMDHVLKALDAETEQEYRSELQLAAKGAVDYQTWSKVLPVLMS
jgi:hypothetical protein